MESSRMDRASFAAACAPPARSPGPATRYGTLWVAGPGERAGGARTGRMVWPHRREAGKGHF
jgi:hypothetical protein